ncbi:TonB-dependent receptor [Gilvimarinus sp. SDUM040013]|uniref:TonB-dependent receptor n=1 Tax=Gilvimarinus gilvus TaxID=3058038 RepID=A0ABU4S6A2_9GAMM|nr:TonB-dependent receptor [Gilvimarinus sp. SDUM040013]MDO3387141.1 TonB-dependent receptor [Gilvimarinus sp. SDUM040013]MDX6850884.1 TonB-dependent receptor [Gilvimarinus sp. SDUM040013]
MYKKTNFKRKLIASAVASCAMTGFSTQALAQEDASMLEEVVVTGIRASLERSMDIKRDSAGVVDAISAEDIGKFPDTNLAESLQRITGVSISRNNGEGSEVTVRGFGAGNNMVTLNGRTMPSASTFNGDGGGSRAFDFANLASEGVSGVEVYKTGKASITTGGIGATINLKTTRPLDNPGFTASVGGKAVMDTSNRAGDDVTPEVSGMFSFSNDSGTFGVALSASHQQRDSGTVGATVNDWGIYEWNDITDPDRAWNNVDVDVTNAPDQGQYYSRFYDLRYEFTDTQRTRDNAQLTVQFAPTDRITGTVDYTFAENQIERHLGQSGQWMQQGDNLQAVTFDDQDIATMVYATETYANGIDEGHEQQYANQTNTLESFGVNLGFQVSDEFSVVLDVHDSEMHSRGTGPYGAGSVRMALANPSVSSREWWFGAEFPTYQNQYDESKGGNTGFPVNRDGTRDPGDISSTMFNLRQADQKSAVTQVKLDASYEFDNGRFDFGVETREMESHTLNYAAENVALGNWNGGYPGEFVGIVEPFDIQGEFEDWSPRDGHGFIGDPVAMYEQAQTYDRYDGIIPVDMTQTADNLVQEDTAAAYFQIELNGELGDMPFAILTGLRYEQTDVFSSSLAARYRSIWESNNDVAIRVDPTVESNLASAEESYDNLLPSFDLTLNIQEDLIGRFSYSKTIARAGLNSLGVSASGFGAGGGSTLLGAVPTASSSNPGLLPLESTNFDLSLEWYYGDTSYVSAGVFEKNVMNFLGSETVNRDDLLGGIRDVTAGPRAQQAASDLAAAGLSLNDDNLLGQFIWNEFAQGSSEWQAEFGSAVYTGTADQNLFLAEQAGWDPIANGDDPVYTFRTSTPNNGREAKIHGAEFAIQHFFGETGFGIQANYTLVRGDVSFDNLGDPSDSQFALVGLSDTANLVGMYENYGFQVRLAYNWRDEYLNETNRGGFGNPRYIEAYSQIDLNVSYEIIDGLSLSFEGINITGENSRSHGRNEAMMWDMYDLAPRYQVGARYTF